MGIGRRLWKWIESRSALEELPLKRVPYDHFNLGAWLGAIVAGSFILLAVTGLILLVYYDPSSPAETNKELLESKPFFNLILTTHLYAAHAMLLSAVVHMLRNFYLKVYRKPRELLWILGVIAGFIALQTAFFGYSLIGDTTSFEAVSIGKGLVASSLGDWLGKTLGALAFGVEGIDFSRVLGFHVLFAALLGLLFMAHFSIFEGLGPFLRRRKTEGELAPWFPVNFLYMLALLLGVWGVITLADAISQAAGYVHRLIYPLPIFEGSKLASTVRPMPPWFLVYAFKLFQLDFLYLSVQGYNALPIFVISLVIPPLVLIIVPFIDRAEDIDPLKRFKATSIVLYLVSIMATLIVWGAATLGYSSKQLAISIFVAPLVVILVGLHFMRLYRLGKASFGRSMIGVLGGVTASIALILGAGFTSGIGTSQVRIEVGVGIFGVMLALLLLLIAKRYSDLSLEFERSVHNTPSTGTSSNDRDIPLFFIGVGVGASILLGISAALFGYAGISALELVKPMSIKLPASLDPLLNPAGIAALASLVLLSLYSIIYNLYRVYTIERIPFKGELKEFIPHIPTLIALLATLALL